MSTPVPVNAPHEDLFEGSIVGWRFVPDANPGWESALNYIMAFPDGPHFEGHREFLFHRNFGKACTCGAYTTLDKERPTDTLYVSPAGKVHYFDDRVC